MKQCTKCNNYKILECFSKDQKRPDGLQLSCKECNRLYYEKNKEKIKEYKELHKKSKQEYDQSYRKNNQSSIQLKDKTYYANNKETIKKRVSEWQKKQAKESHYRITKSLRDRLRKAIKNGQKNGSAIKDLGCSIEEFKKYLETLFDINMSWDNHGFDGWHIDHIKPLCTFDLTNIEEFKKACHYSNLQPLWATENLAKAKK